MLLPDLLVIDENNFIVDNNIAKLKKSPLLYNLKRSALFQRFTIIYFSKCKHEVENFT